jgi:hypothetical protein
VPTQSSNSVRVCPDCHHPPSRRFDPENYCAQCFCACHDAADAAPALLAACKAMLEANYMPDSAMTIAVAARNAIALAEGRDP